MRQKVTNGTTRGPHRCCPDSHCPRHTSSGLEYSDYSYRQILQAGTEEEVRRKGLLKKKKKKSNIFKLQGHFTVFWVYWKQHLHFRPFKAQNAHLYRSCCQYLVSGRRHRCRSVQWASADTDCCSHHYWHGKCWSLWLNTTKTFLADPNKTHNKTTETDLISWYR